MKTIRVTRCCIEEEHSIHIAKETMEIAVLVPTEENLRLITLDPQVTNPENVQYIIVSQISSCMGEYLQQLLDKTTEQEFPKTKKSLQNANHALDRLQITSYI